MKYRLSLDELKLKYNRLVGKTVFSKEMMHGHIEEFLYPVLLVNEAMDLQAMLDGQIEDGMDYELFLQALCQCGFDTINIVKPFDWSHIRRVLSKVPLNDDDDFWFFSLVFHGAISYINPNNIQRMAMYRYIQKKVALFEYVPETERGKTIWEKFGLHDVDQRLYGIFGKKLISPKYSEMLSKQYLFLMQGEDFSEKLCDQLEQWYQKALKLYPYICTGRWTLEGIAKRDEDLKEELWTILSYFSENEEALYEKIKDCIHLKSSFLEYEEMQII